MSFRKNIAADLFRHTKLKLSIKNIIIGLFVPGFRYMFFFRLASSKESFLFLNKIFAFILKRYEYKYSFQIPVNTNIGKGLYIGHHGTIIVNEKAQIGSNCNIAPGVVIGQANRGKLKGVPIIGDYVWMGVNAVLVGNIKIGSNVLIAPGAYVNFDVPNNSVVIGNPGKVIYNEFATKDYIINAF